MLEQLPLFAGLSEEDLAAIERLAVPKHYRKNTVVIQYGDEANTLYFLVKGRAKIYMPGEDGKEVVFGERGPGAYVGELALLAEGRRSASVETLEDSDFLVLTQTSFKQILAEHPDIALVLLRDLAKRLCEISEDVGDLALRDVYSRIAKWLQSSATEESGRLITGRLTHQDIADRVGSSREMVSKILKDLRIGGYLEIDKKRMVLLRPLPERW